jgi:putative Mg2+ transporter-C (MgtC) family protein
VIFKEGMSINGLTTAALIWVTAALGMAAGLGNYVMVAVVLAVVLFTLFILQFLQELVDRTHNVTVYKIKYAHHSFSQKELEAHFKQERIKFTLIHLEKESELISITYRIISNNQIHQALNDYFINNNAIHSFTV